MDKQELIKELQKDWEKHWKVELFDEKGFERKQCESCGSYFWTVDGGRTTCGEVPCDDYSFIGIEHKDWGYNKTWEEVENFFEKEGHTSIPRYPVICRWRPDLHFNVASIIDFQRLGSEGVEFHLPENPLIVPQVCLRFNDLPNIGVTGRHHSCFTMLGQHAIPQGGKGYWKDRTMELDWELCTEVLDIRPENLTFKEDAWAGGGAYGYSLEWISKGLELGNSVFTEFRNVNGERRELATPVVDVGAGFDRFIWYLNGTLTSYDSVFGPVMDKLKEEIEWNGELFARYARLSGAMDFENPLQAKRARKEIADELNVTNEELKEEIGQLQAAYQIADHTKALLFALNDGGLPSSVGGGYNLRVVLRKAQGLIDDHGLSFSLLDVMEWHADHLQDTHPELAIDDRIRDIMETELDKFSDTRQKVEQKVEQMASEREGVSDEELIELYDSEGITPELVAERMDVEVPDDFYARVTERHMGGGSGTGEPDFDTNLAPTEQLCHDEVYEHDAEVLDVQGDWVVLDESAFYPEGGGQAPDEGTIGGVEVVDVQKADGTVFHKVEDPSVFSTGDRVKCHVDKERRKQIVQHHDATHIISGCARKLLGPHAWQHGALKEEDRARIDITHYKRLSEEELRELENCANRIVEDGRSIRTTLHPSQEAEKEFGFEIYQGGVPQGELRIVEIDQHDIEACGGTHDTNTGSVGEIVITGTERVQDGVIRINFLAGEAAQQYIRHCSAVADELCELLGSEPEELEEEVATLLEGWKAARKELDALKQERAEDLVDNLEFQDISTGRLLVASVDGDSDQLQKISRELTEDDTIIFLFGSSTGDGVPVFAAAGSMASRDYQVGKLLKTLFDEVGGQGGGSPALGQGVVPEEKLDEAMEWLEERIK